MALLDVNVLVALAWDSHVHHLAAREWFVADAPAGWSTCSTTENGFLRVSANRRVLPAALDLADARTVLTALRAVGAHRFLPDDVSPLDPDVPAVRGHRQITDAHLLTVARRAGEPLVTFDRALGALGGPDVLVLAALP
ncbi:TA system VapC family ribonuclease toxin [Klenkia sp. PcliD-1-E]|uniref:TA system VapC family ribonuclease toxin n=1 Tax=Klenkia sp. PcliD-1-E TaxID=2954492 RepID=UPI002097F499|nr:TA system VapC family ribonuclease toxin [Klenkia sp. PcliD-1-E]MCO7220444.1 VapC toxin family PIN domain ribonuclease [Klenkia sp. PcliD-1-E]